MDESDLGRDGLRTLTLACWEVYFDVVDDATIHASARVRGNAPATSGYNDDAMEMVRDTEREVWRILDDMKPAYLSVGLDEYVRRAATATATQ